MAQAVSHWPLTAAAWVRSRVRFCDGKSGKETGVSPSTSVLLCQSFHQCSTLVFNYMPLLPEGQKGEAWEPSKKQYSFENWEALNRRVFSLNI